MDHPLRFFVGAGVVLLTLLICQFSRRQIFCLTLVSSIWLALGVTNSILLQIRATPLSAVDLIVVQYAVSIWYVYFTPLEMGLIVLGVLALITACVYLWRRGPRLLCRRRHLRSAVLAVTLFALLVGGNAMGLGMAESDSPDLEEIYEDYGFAYCFSQSFLDRGMDEPDTYSEDAVKRIVADLPEETTEASANIIFVQLESFVDVGRVSGLELSENPAPTYSALREEYPGGLLTVSTLGGGTIFTEFEVLTGMNMGHLGVGAYPFTTIVEETTLDSMAYALSGLGYTTTAIHNHQGTFYDRHLGYSQLGFDRFVPLEYMPESDLNVNGWAEDALLTGEIMDVLTESDGPDYIHAVAVQTHGQYPTDEPEEPYPIQVLSDIDESDRYAVEYYVSQMREVDSFIEGLIAELEEFDEDVVLVLYGDHLPGIYSLYDLDEGDRYQTEYVIWSNFDLEAESRTLSTYELGAYVQQCLGISAGIMPRYHQSMSDTGNYHKGAAQLQYDMLYGEGYAYLDEGKPDPTDMAFGTHLPEITGLNTTASGLEVEGENFNPYSRVYVDGKEVDTEYISATELVADIIPESGQKVYICQVSGNGEIMGSQSASMRVS